MKFLSQILNVQLKIAIILLLVCTSSFASNVVVKSEFLEVFTAAGRGYPIFFVIENGENFELLNRKTDWIKIKSEQGQIGWISYLDYAESVHLAKPNTRNVAVRSNWELGAAIGKFSSDNTFSASAAYYMKPTVAVQAEYKKIIGKYSHSNLVSGQFMFQVYRKKLFSPFVSLGMGIIHPGNH